MKKFVSLFLCLAMLFSMLVTTTMAAGGSSNVIVETNTNTVEAGKTFTVTIENTDMTVASIACGIFFDTTKVKCVSIVGSDPDDPNWFAIYKSGGKKYSEASAKPNVDGSNTTGTVGFTWIGTEETAYIAGTIATVTFKVDAAATGSVDILVYETSDGTDGINLGNKYDTYEDAKNDATLGKQTVTIVAPTVPVTGVELSSNTLSLDIGGTAKLTATVLPNGASNTAVTFESNNTAVATVDAEGNVTAKAEGQATITVKTADGGFTAQCVVTVACVHDYSKEDTAAQGALKSEGNCQNQAEYYKSCTKCGKVSDTETFFGEKNPNKHADDEATWTKTAEKHSQTWKCCDAVVVPEEDHEWGNDSVCDECGYGCDQHVGGTASCVQKATCDYCGQSYGDFADHSFTAETKSAQTLKTAGTCNKKAVYFKTCSVDGCGVIATDAAYTFEGEFDEDNHVGQTETVNAKPADHKNQIDGYTGDTKCLDCGEIIANGTAIPAGDHVASLTWTTDDTNHWKVCVVENCGVEIDGSRAAHYSNKAENKATCKKAAVCDACGVSYGQSLSHVPATTMSKDASGHWYDCQYGCGEKLSFEAHTPDHQGGATEDYAVKCSNSECQYVIEQQLAHTHDFNQQKVENAYKATDATCVKPATYYWVCRCGEKSSDTYEYGEKDTVNGHNWDSAWSGADNADNHWHACLNGCGEKQDETRHDYTQKSNYTKHWEECVCGRKINEGNHIDTDKDNQCDTCGHTMVRPGPSHFGHWDYNGDGKCDYCGVKTNCTHTDANNDGKCDSCSSSMKTQSAQTFDAGIVMYAGMAVLAATGSVAMIGKKRKEQ